MLVTRFTWFVRSMLIALLATAFGSATASADTGPHPEFQQQQQSIDELSQLSGQDFEVGYINRIIPHHQSALQMAQAMQPKVVNQPLKDEIDQMISSQTQEIQQLTTYLQQTYGQAVQPDSRFQMDPSMMQQLQAASPQQAEQMFMLMMREHHESANQLGQLVLSKDVSDTLTTQAQKMIDDQTAQQQRFAGYLSDWYGITAPQPTGDIKAGMEFAMAAQNMPGMPNTGDGGMAGSRAGGSSTALWLAGAALLVAVIGGGVATRRWSRARL